MKFLNELFVWLLVGFLLIAAFAGSAGLAIKAIRFMFTMAKGGL